MGGGITVASELGKGSVFTIRLPARARERQSDVAAAAAPAPEPAGGRDVVLVIDDDPVARDLMSRTLQSDGYQVVTAERSEDCLRLARQIRPMAVTLDLLMPGVDGWGVLAAMKADEELRDIPIVVVTILDGAARGAGAVLGASEFLTKPVDRKTLVQTLGKFRPAASAGEAGPILVIEDDEPTRELISRALKAEGWPVTEACDGRAGLESAARQMPSAIVLDLMMPGMDGFEFISRFQESAAAPHVPIVVLTAMNVSDEDRARLGRGVLSVLTKGDGAREALVGRLRRMIKGLARARQ